MNTGEYCLVILIIWYATLFDTLSISTTFAPVELVGDKHDTSLGLLIALPEVEQLTGFEDYRVLLFFSDVRKSYIISP